MDNQDVRSLSVLSQTLTLAQIEALLKCVTTDDEGNLSYDELVDMLIK